MKYTMALTPDEDKEYRELKLVLNYRGFLFPEEKLRWDVLFKKLSSHTIAALQDYCEKERLEISN